MNIATSNSSIAHTTGNVTFILTEYLKGMFPEKFFNHTHITSRMPYKEFQINENRQSDQFIKKVRPILIIRPRVILNNDDIFMSKSRLTREIEGVKYTRTGAYYQTIFKDNDAKVALNFLMTRMRLELQCTVMVDTQVQQIDVFNAILSTHNENQIYKMNTATEIFVPKPFVKAISTISGVPERDPDTGIPRNFLNYLTMHSNRYWTFKEKNATQEEEYFIYFPISLEYVFTNYSMEDVSKKGDVIHSADISFILTAEFNTISSFLLASECDDVVEKANAVMHMDTSMGTKIRPFYTVNNLFGATDENGWKMYYSNIFMLDPDVKREDPDILDLSSIFKDTALQDILDYHKKNGISNDILFNFIIMKNNVKLKDKKLKETDKIDYVVELENQRILIYNKNYNATYRIVIYINNLYIMTLMNRVSDWDSTYERDMKRDKGREKINETKKDAGAIQGSGGHIEEKT
jgi:hypothetical protein